LSVGQRLKKSPKLAVSLSCNPWQDVGKGVFQGTGQAVSEPHVVAAQTAAVFDEVR
jgi:hypothetical protein